MLDYHVAPTDALNGEIRLPGDKSISHRSLIFGSIANGSTKINGFLMGKDNLATMDALQKMGVDILCIDDENIVRIQGVGLHGLQAPPDQLNLGNSGTGLRLLSGLLVTQTFDATLTGDRSLRKRPMNRVVEPLRQMGAGILASKEGTPPIKITGGKKLKGINYQSPIASAQVKSCLLIAGIYAEGNTIITEPEKSRDHTERMLKAFGYPVIQRDKTTEISSGGTLTATNINIPADISSAAFFIVAATITPKSSIVLRDVGVNPTRIGIVNILKEMGADIQITNEREQNFEPVADIQVSYSELKGIDIPHDQVPFAIDEFPVIFVAAACAKGTTRLTGAKELRFKETDRLRAMEIGLKNLGINVETQKDGITIEGGQLQGGEVDSFGDHRIAMAFSIAGTVAKGPVTIHDCDNVATSFPNFLDLAVQTGMRIKKSD